MVSHELRTPLNAIIGFSEIIACELYGPLGAPQYKEYAEHVRASGHKLLRLVNQVMEIARLEGHAVDIDARPEPLDHAIEDALGCLRDEIAGCAAQIQVEDAHAMPVALADGRGLRTLLVNLIQNAVTYGGGSAVVRARRAETPSGAFVEITVEDSGPGVPAADLSRLLRPFEQGEDALTRAGGGVGLGLPIVRLLAESMGGSLRLRSEPGRGFTATITLPAA